MRSYRSAIALGVALIFAIGGPAAADIVQLAPVKDNTLYQDAADDGLISNAKGVFMFAGKLGNNAVGMEGFLRRAVIEFNVVGNVPAGSTINSATLTVTVTMSPDLINRTNTLHKLTSDWGEGTSAGVGNEALGAAATVGDATWKHKFSPSTNWGTLGGDFVAQQSASEDIAGAGPYTFGSTAGMVADVQAWLDDESTNFGWILRGDETAMPTARQFASRENLSAAIPVLTIDFTPGAVGQVVITPAINLLLDNN